MARTSIATARAELYGLLVADTAKGTPVQSLRDLGVMQVFDHEPLPGEMPWPLVITIQTDGMDPTDYRYALRVYSHVSLGAQLSQARLDAIVELVDDLTNSGRWGASQWRVRYHENFGAYVATNLIEAGREDF